MALEIYWQPTMKLRRYDDSAKLTNVRLQQKWTREGMDEKQEYEWRDVPLVWEGPLNRYRKTREFKMTIEVRIENKDSSRTLQVSHVEHDKNTGRSSEHVVGTIAPGGANTFHCYLLRDLLVRELDLVSKSVA